MHLQNYTYPHHRHMTHHCYNNYLLNIGFVPYMHYRWYYIRLYSTPSKLSNKQMRLLHYTLCVPNSWLDTHWMRLSHNNQH